MNRRRLLAALAALCTPAIAKAISPRSIDGAVPVLIDDHGFLHMGGWVRGPEPRLVGDTFVLLDYDHVTQYRIVGRYPR